MTPSRRKWTLLTTIAAALSLAFAASLFAQPEMGGAKKKANEAKAEHQKKENEKAQDPKEPTVFAMGPDEKARFEIDPDSKRNVMKFESKAPGETIDSKVNKVTGYIEFNPRKLDSAEGKFTVSWKDVDTGNKMRNTHMMGKDWVNADAHPEIVYTVTGITKTSAKDKPIKSIKCELVGKMAMNGVEKDMNIPVTLNYLESASTPKKGEAPKDMLGIKAAKFKIALADFNIKGKAGAVGSKVAGEQEFTTVAFMLTGPEHKADPNKKPPVIKAPPAKKPVKGA